VLGLVSQRAVLAYSPKSEAPTEAHLTDVREDLDRCFADRRSETVAMACEKVTDCE